jgi:O-antigen ligase
VGAAQIQYAGAPTIFSNLVGLATLAAAVYLLWTVEPVYTICAALLLSPISGNWEQLGVPGYASPDRVLLVAAVIAVVFRAPGAGGRPRIQLEPVHWLMLAAAAYVTLSALRAGTLGDRSPLFQLLESFGLLPFVLFVLIPVTFRTERQREVLLKTFVGLGAYLGLTSLFETIHLKALIWPRYILDPAYGVNPDHARGPFVEPVTNGFALFVCSVACAIAWSRWRTRPIAAPLAAGVGLLCIAGTFMSLQRSVWLGVGIATVIALLAASDTRRYAPQALAGMAVVVALSLALIPGFSDRVSNRADNQETIWDRKNLNRAAANMIAERPLLGFGWSQFVVKDKNYFQQSRDYPLTNVSGIAIHSTLILYAVELGLVGMLLWLATLVAGVGGALSARGPPDLRAWRVGLLAIAVCFVVTMNFVPPARFPTLIVWVWAGVAWAGRYAAREEIASRTANATISDPSYR